MLGSVGCRRAAKVLRPPLTTHDPHATALGDYAVSYWSVILTLRRRIARANALGFLFLAAEATKKDRQVQRAAGRLLLGRSWGCYLVGSVGSAGVSLVVWLGSSAGNACASLGCGACL